MNINIHKNALKCLLHGNGTQYVNFRVDWLVRGGLSSEDVLALAASPPCEEDVPSLIVIDGASQCTAETVACWAGDTDCNLILSFSTGTCSL